MPPGMGMIELSTNPTRMSPGPPKRVNQLIIEKASSVAARIRSLGLSDTQRPRTLDAKRSCRGGLPSVFGDLHFSRAMELQSDQWEAEPRVFGVEKCRSPKT